MNEPTRERLKRPQDRAEWYQSAWRAHLIDRLNKDYFPALTQRTGKLSPGKRLARFMRLRRDRSDDLPPTVKAYGKVESSVHRMEIQCNQLLDPKRRIDRKRLGQLVAQLGTLAELGLWLETAVLGRDTAFLRNYRNEYGRKLSDLSRVRSWLLFHPVSVRKYLSNQRKPVELYRRYKADNPDSKVSFSNFSAELRELPRGVSKPRQQPTT